MKVLKKGVLLLKLFVALVILDIVLAVCFFAFHWSWDIRLAVSAVVLGLAECGVFWAGITAIYISSLQLGVKMRVIGIACGWIPIVNLAVLCRIIHICSNEVRFEEMTLRRDAQREKEQICRTRYPILLVHGVFFRDSDHLSYWGRIPKSLKRNGAVFFYGNHNSASSVADSAKELKKRVRQILDETGAEKVNIIAHSKGGLDARMMIRDHPEMVASLTTINTPHRGCEFADYLFGVVGEKQKEFLASNYNRLAAKFGDTDPDFLSAVYDLTSSRCAKMNDKVQDADGVYYQSFGSVLHRASSGKFPLNFTYHLVKYFDGENDGLVGTGSFRWGQEFHLLKNERSERGISHADMIDLNRENIDGFDVREFYVQLVAGLKQKGF